MARGKKCPQCGHQMYAVDERDEPMGSWVVYECRNSSCRFQEKVFEGKRMRSPSVRQLRTNR